MVTASARRDKQLFRWDRRCAGSGGYAIALLASLAVTTTASPAAAAYWDGGEYKHHTAHKTHEAKAADRTDGTGRPNSKRPAADLHFDQSAEAAPL